MKKIRFTIGNKILGTFLALIFIFTLNAILSIITLNRSNEIIKENSEVINPSMAAINDFTLLVTRSKMLTTNWVYLNFNNIEDKEALKNLIDFEYPELKERIENISSNWKNEQEKMLMDSILNNFEELVEVEKEIMQALATFDDYEDGFTKMMQGDVIEDEVLPKTSKIINQLERLGKVKDEETKKADLSLLESFSSLRTMTISLGIIIVALGLISAFFMTRAITQPIKYIKGIILKLGKGELPSEDRKASFSKDEIGEMALAVESLVNGLKSTSQFADNIGNGNYDAEYTPLSENDVLGNALLEMRSNLKRVAEEDKKRNWATEGLAKFGEILRKNNDNINKLSDEIISNLIKYLKANQGGLFIINDENENDQYLSLAACYAWDKKKYLEQKIYIGDGLTGQAWMEKDTVYLTEVPNDYVNITSGLGEANPNSILIVPLKVNDEVFGVIEIASFNSFQRYEIEFVEKIAESIASTISSVKINERTQRLLEESTQMTEQMRSQEEEMRQNMEELQATQEEMERGQRDREDKENIISSTHMFFELNENNTIINVNGLVKELLKYDSSEILGKPFDSLLVAKEPFQDALDRMEKAKTWSGILQMNTKKNQAITLKISAGKSYDVFNDTNKYLIFATEIGTQILA
jgi:PAS domain-containing protein/HAMP domain-containing protein